MPSDLLTDQRVLILGLARQGIALAKWLCSVGATVTVSDMRPAEKLSDALQELEGLPIQFELGDHPPRLLNDTDVLCLSGGVPLDTPIVKFAIEKQIPLTNDAQIFLERCPSDVIGITGSAGKTTTTTLVGAMCEAGGVLPWVGGNIGNPLIADLRFIKPDDISVMELSSFQLEIMTSSPRIAAILNITPNHLDRHGSMETYTNAKARIFESQMTGDTTVLGYDDPVARSLAERVEQQVAFFSSRVPVDVGAWLVDERLVMRPKFEAPMEPVCTIGEIPLRGRHNVMNVLAACAIAGVAGVHAEAMRDAILKFKPVAHRLEVVRTIDGVTYVNDSIATAPERVTAALDAFPDEPIVLLLGGRDKKLPWDDLLQLAVRRCRAIITFGEAGLMIAERAAKARAEAGVAMPLEQAGSMQEMVMLASDLSESGDVVLLSPGCTSFDQYADFEVRGEDFRKVVKALAGQE